MERYNYREVITADILDYIRDNYTPEEIRDNLINRDGFEERLNDDLWICDSVTGNASGSYYCNTWKAEEAIAHNLDLLGEALQEFGGDAGYLINNGAEAADVTIRCYLLGECIAEALDEFEEEYPPEDESENEFDIFCGKYLECKKCPFYDLETVDECRKAFEKMQNNN